MRQIKLKNGFRFCWHQDEAGEVGGHIETPEGGALRGSAGWYRTTNPEQAAKLAEEEFLGGGSNAWIEAHKRGKD